VRRKEWEGGREKKRVRVRGKGREEWREGGRE
jgi:hypothetical protein